VLVAELIVCTDGSTDRTAELAESLGAHVLNSEHAGLSAARNRCINAAKQPWLAFIDSDDIWEPDKIEHQMRMADRNPELALITCDYSAFNETEIIHESVLNKYRTEYECQSKRQVEGGAIIDRLDPGFANAYYFLLASNLLVRRDALLLTGLFDVNLHSADDFDCFMRLLAKQPLGIVERVLVRRREHTESTSRRPTAALSCLHATYKVLENPELYPEATVELCKQWLPSNLRHAGARLVLIGEAKRGRDLLLESARLEINPRTVLALGASVLPAQVARELMKARYYVSRTFGL
jgi:glycosyltransferase involved in cell wall biosynthesis